MLPGIKFTTFTFEQHEHHFCNNSRLELILMNLARPSRNYSCSDLGQNLLRRCIVSKRVKSLQGSSSLSIYQNHSSKSSGSVNESDFFQTRASYLVSHALHKNQLKWPHRSYSTKPPLTESYVRSLNHDPKLPRDSWYFVAAVAFAALNRPDVIPDLLKVAIEKRERNSDGEGITVVRRLREALLKSAAVIGLPKVRSFLITLNTSLSFATSVMIDSNHLDMSRRLVKQ